jgi:uncharacterized protein YhdP
MSASLATSGLFAKAEGSAARKLCAVIARASSPMTGLSILYSVEFRIGRVKKEPSSNLKTGESKFKDWPNLHLRFFKAFTGQTLQLCISNRSTISP